MHKKVNQYNAFKLNEYNGTHEIMSGNEDEAGKFWPDWAIASEYDPDVGYGIPVTKDDGSYRNVPVKVVLGNLQQAIENVKWLLGELEGHEAAQPPGNNNPPSDDVPF